MSTEITGCPAAWNAFTLALICSELQALRSGVVGTFLAGLAVGLQAEVETFRAARPTSFLTGDEAPLGQRRGEMALARADPPQRLPRGHRGSTAPPVHSKLPRSRAGSRSRASVRPPCGEPARCTADRPGPEVRQAAAYGAAGNSGGPRNRGNSAAPGSACFTGREQASVSFIEERSECIVAGPDGILVDHPARLHAKTPDAHRLFRIRSLRYCRILESFLPSRFFTRRPLEEEATSAFRRISRPARCPGWAHSCTAASGRGQIGRFRAHDVGRRTCVRRFAGFWEIRLDSARVMAAA